MEVEVRWSDENPLATNDGCGKWIYQHKALRRRRSTPKKALSGPARKLDAFFPNVSRSRQQWLKNFFLYACSGWESGGDSPPPSPTENDDLNDYLDAERPFYRHPFPHAPTIAVGEQLNVSDLLGNNLLSFNTSSQNIPSIQPNQFRSYVGLHDPKMGADRGINSIHMSKLSICTPGKRNPDVQPPGARICVNDIVKSNTVMACSSSTTPDKENVNVESTLNLKGKYVIICCVFAPSTWDSEDGTMVYHTALASHEIAKRDDIVLVVVPMMRKGFTHHCSAYQQFLSGFSCLAVPFVDSYRREYICSALRFDGELIVLVLDPSQKVIYHGPPFMFLWYGVAEIDCFHFTPGRGDICLRPDTDRQDLSLNELLGLSDTDVLYNIESLTGGRLKEDGCITISELKRKLVGLYVCSAATSLRRLQEVYKECKEKGYDLEIVVVCFPFDGQVPPEFQEKLIIDALARFKLLGWWYFPFDNTVCHRLRRMCEIDSGKESLFIVDPIK
ncbi:unnamed protein product [Cuscuta campestris]|uniref:Uncharacterized protein n=1 Tax=Cuscuta campestris TaxID=132261 RepID=A0A484K1I2_9ASTE|nr:unnamed protein product [Cuscuta campestris]